MRYRPIEDYGIIGDLHTVALVSSEGSIDFMCFPEFDSPTIFAALLDWRHGGSFQLAPILHPAQHRQLYLPDSNILLTRFISERGLAEVLISCPFWNWVMHMIWCGEQNASAERSGFA